MGESMSLFTTEDAPSWGSISSQQRRSPVDVAFAPRSGSGCRGRGRQSTPHRQPRGARSSHATRAQRGMFHHESVRALSGIARQRRLGRRRRQAGRGQDRSGAVEPPMKLIHVRRHPLRLAGARAGTREYDLALPRHGIAQARGGAAGWRPVRPHHPRHKSHTSGRNDRPDSHRPRDHRLHSDHLDSRGHRRTTSPVPTRRWSRTSRS